MKERGTGCEKRGARREAGRDMREDTSMSIPSHLSVLFHDITTTICYVTPTSHLSPSLPSAPTVLSSTAHHSAVH